MVATLCILYREIITNQLKKGKTYMISIAYAPLVVIGALIVILIIAGFLSRNHISKLKLFEKMLTDYASCGIDKDGKPTLKYHS